MATAWEVTGSEHWTFLDGLNNPVNGYRVTYVNKQYNETGYVTVKTLDAGEVKAKIDKAVADRAALAKL